MREFVNKGELYLAPDGERDKIGQRPNPNEFEGGYYHS